MQQDQHSLFDNETQQLFGENNQELFAVDFMSEEPNDSLQISTKQTLEDFLSIPSSMPSFTVENFDFGYIQPTENHKVLQVPSPWIRVIESPFMTPSQTPFMTPLMNSPYLSPFADPLENPLSWDGTFESLVDNTIATNPGLIFFNT